MTTLINQESRGRVSSKSTKKKRKAEIDEQRAEAICEEIREKYAEFTSLFADALDRAFELGDLLIELKDCVPHGKWEEWLTLECQFGARQAQKFTRLSRNKDRDDLMQAIQDGTVDTIDQADRLIRSAKKSNKMAARIGGPDSGLTAEYPRIDSLQAAALRFETSTSVWDLQKEAFREIDKAWQKVFPDENKLVGGRHLREPNGAYTGYTSDFSPGLAYHILMRYAGEAPGRVLDLFAGNPTRASITSWLGYEYHGIDIRWQALDDNQFVVDHFDFFDQIHLYEGDGTELAGVPSDLMFDFCFSCPPYFDKEIYSDKPGDLSALSTYTEFDERMQLCAKRLSRQMKPGAYVCLVIGFPNREKGTTQLLDMRGDTVANFVKAGFLFHQDIILVKHAGDPRKAAGIWRGEKLIPQHEHLVVFKTPPGDEKKQRPA